jgi:predicted NUDIX family NTP pyrophosphohydrolase
MPKTTFSAGLLMFRRTRGELEVFLVHPGGPFCSKKDAGVWSVPKGLVAEHESNESPLEAARREFGEETGFPVHEPLFDLGTVTQKGGKTVHAWAFEADADPAAMRSNTFSLEWPPKSGRFQEIPEVDRGDFFSLPAARDKINAAQVEFLERLLQLSLLLPFQTR